MQKIQKMIFTGLMMAFLLLAASAWSRETTVVAAQSGECTLSVEADDECRYKRSWPNMAIE